MLLSNFVCPTIILYSCYMSRLVPMNQVPPSIVSCPIGIWTDYILSQWPITVKCLYILIFWASKFSFWLAYENFSFTMHTCTNFSVCFNCNALLKNLNLYFRQAVITEVYEKYGCILESNEEDAASDENTVFLVPRPIKSKNGSKGKLRSSQGTIDDWTIENKLFLC